MKLRESATIASSIAAALCAVAFVGGCANPPGIATALSAIVSVSSPAASTPAFSSPAVSSSAAGSTHILDSTQVSGALAADSQRQLVISYVGGVCDVAARGEAIENGPSITVHVLVTVLNGACTAQGFDRTVTARLAAPWGDRVVRDVTGATVPVIDGVLLLRPSWLPDGYQGGPIYVSASDGNVAAGQEWALPMVPASPTVGVGSCTPSSAVVDLSQGYGLGLPPSVKLPPVQGSHTLADGTAVTVYTDQGELLLFWTPQRHPQG
jgi:hypothetical protein